MAEMGRKTWKGEDASVEQETPPVIADSPGSTTPTGDGGSPHPALYPHR